MRDLYRPVWSDQILAELERFHVRVKHRNPVTVRAILDRMRADFPDASVNASRRVEDGLKTDPGDRHVLATAICARAPLIVTDNLVHFPPEALTPYGIRALNTDAFLMLLFQDHGAEMAETVRMYADFMLDPQQSITIVLHRLERCGAHVFAASMRDRFSA